MTEKIMQLSSRLVIVLIFSTLFSVANAQVVATVGKSKITLEDFNKRYDEVKRQAINPPGPEVFLEDLIRYEVGIQEAEKMKIENDPVIKEEIRRVIYKGMIEKSIGKSVENIKVNEEEMRKFYRDNPELRTSHILIEVKEGATAAQLVEAEKRANDIYNEVKKSKRPFEELVKLYTDDTVSKNTGGDIGYQSKVTLVPTYYDVAKSMSLNEIKGLVRSRYGFHIIKLTGKRNYQQANKLQIRAAVFDEKRKVVFDKYFDTLKSKYSIKKDNNLIKKIK